MVDRLSPDRRPPRQRPDYIDLGPRTFDVATARAPSPNSLSSPRAGDVPPALSPLDALALQGRMLAKRFEDAESNGRRISRLPHLTVASELAKPRPGYFGVPSPAMSDGEPIRTPQSGSSAAAAAAATSPEVAVVDLRPTSHYPSIQQFDDTASIISRDSGHSGRGLDEAGAEQKPMNAKDYFDMARSVAHAPTTRRDRSMVASSQMDSVSEVDFAPEALRRRLNTSGKINTTGSNYASGLAPPQSPGRLHSPLIPPSIRSIQRDSGEDSDGYSFEGDPYDLRKYERRVAGGSGISRSASPFAPSPRPSSASSSVCVGGRHHASGSVNFSRPLSRQSDRPSDRRPPSPDDLARRLRAASPLPQPYSQPSAMQDPIGSHALHSDPFTINPEIEARISAEEEGRLLEECQPQTDTSGDVPKPAPSYIYTKYSLPRGRALSRNFVSDLEEKTHTFEWQQKSFGESNVTRIDDGTVKGGWEGTKIFVAEPYRNVSECDTDRHHHQQSNRQKQLSRSLPVSTNPSPISHTDFLNTIPALLSSQVDTAIHDHTDTMSPAAALTSISNQTQYQISSSPTSASGSRTKLTAGVNDATDSTTKLSRPIIPSLTTDKNSTPTLTRASKINFPAMNTPPPDHLSAEAHLARGIACHEEGSLQKSTYHLRIAARAGLPTAMLLYALACRHGWGMRPNQAEGVGWLRKAVDCAGLEVSDDRTSLSSPHPDPDGDGSGSGSGSGRKTDQRRTHKAELALSIYELGVSYMNGWGIAQDKPLALRCFEIAGGWGDGDALAEAGFCYVKGVGCKKDLRKAAHLYRRAEAKGIEMAGNSWIYKDKYMSQDKEKKARDKSRTRTVFGGKKSIGVT